MKKLICLLVLLLSPAIVYAGKGYSAGGKSYSAGKSASKAPSFKPSPSPSPSPKPSFKPSPAPKVSPDANKKGYFNKKSGFDGGAAQAKQKEESKQAFLKGSQPKPSFKDGKGKERPVDPKDKQVQDLRKQLNAEKFARRQERERNVYTPYWDRPIIHYGDHYNSFFWYWLLDRSIEERALWAYHHRQNMDEARYRDLLAKDARLEGRVRELEAKKVAQDPAYVPPGLDSDLQYTDDYVNAAYNPEPSGVGTVIVVIFLVVSIVGLFVWLIFFKEF